MQASSYFFQRSSRKCCQLTPKSLSAARAGPAVAPMIALMPSASAPAANVDTFI